MRITSKGQVTIPKHVREKLRIEPGDEIGFRVEGQAVIVYKDDAEVEMNSGQELVRQLLGKGPELRQGRPMMTSDEVIEITRGRAIIVDDTH